MQKNRTFSCYDSRSLIQSIVLGIFSCVPDCNEMETNTKAEIEEDEVHRIPTEEGFGFYHSAAGKEQ